MPRIVDYSTRIDCLREAVFFHVLEDGVSSITLEAVAARAGISVATARRSLRTAHSLPRLGFQWATGRFRNQRWSSVEGEPSGDEPWVEPLRLLLRDLPSTKTLAENERVRHALVTAHLPHATWAAEDEQDRKLALEAHCRHIVSAAALEMSGADQAAEAIAVAFLGATAAASRGLLTPDRCVPLVRDQVIDLIAASRGEVHGPAA